MEEGRTLSTDPALPAVQVAVSSEKGLREENQDWLSWIQSSKGELFIIADGMGGHKGGAQAAKLTVDVVEKKLREAPADQPFNRALEEAIHCANEEVHRASHSGNPDTENMGSTIVVALAFDGKVQIGHVGDSRAYLYRKKQLKLLTHDHTRVQQMIDAGVLTPTQAHNHPEAHVLSRAIGSRPDVEVEIGPPHRLEEGDALLLCSDGLSGFVNDTQISKVLENQPDVQRVPDDLVRLAMAAGGNDNITVQFVRFGKSVRERWTAKLPIAAEPVAQVSRVGLWGSVARIARRPVAWATVTMVLAFASVAAFRMPSPSVEFSYSLEQTPTGPQAQLQWTTHQANALVIEPDIGLEPVPLAGRAPVPVPVGAPVTYTARASVTRFMFWTVNSDESLTIVPPVETPKPETPSAPPAPPIESTPTDVQPADPPAAAKKPPVAAKPKRPARSSKALDAPAPSSKLPPPATKDPAQAPPDQPAPAQPDEPPSLPPDGPTPIVPAPVNEEPW